VRFQIMSDLHIDHPGARGFPPPSPGVEVVLIGGDVCDGLPRAIQQTRSAYPAELIVQIAGNHEFYGKPPYGEHLALGRECAHNLGVCLLENDSVVLGDGTRIIGTTLWTDYTLLGDTSRIHAMHVARDIMQDHKRIKWSKQPWRRFRPEEARQLHLTSRAFIESELRKDHDGPTIVLTHHAPIVAAVQPNLRDRLISSAYASDLHDLVNRYQPDYWISGHTHYSYHALLGRTRLLSNPCGYADENRSFDPALTIDINP
jgi:hypothetical protein